ENEAGKGERVQAEITLLTITPLTITPNNPTRVYGATDNLAYSVGGLLDGDVASEVVTGTLSRTSGDDAGDYAIGMGTLAVESAYADKYSLPAAPSVAAYTITPRPVTAISGVTVASRAADGTTDATFDTSAANGTGVLSAELADFRAGGLQVSGAFPLAVPGTHDVSVTYSLQDHGSFKAANYTLSATSDTLRGELEAAPQPACTPAVNGDYDRDNDGLIEICSLDQLNAIRFDNKGNGRPERGLAYEYSLAFPGVLTHGPGCADGCRGYELVVDLDFDTNGDGKADAGDQFWNEGLGWEPMPILDRKFTGTFEGNGHTISSLYMNKPANMSRVGLFQVIGSGARVHNVTLDNVYVKGGGEHIGGLVGVNNHHASIKNSHVSGEVHSDHDVGLLVGENHGLIDASSSSGTVTGNIDVGILAGENFGTITRSSASGNASGHTAVGGLIGKQLANSTVGGSSAVATVTGTASDGHSIGGLVGDNHGHVLASMARATVTGPADNIGGLVGNNRSEGAVVATYAWGETTRSGIGHAGGLVGVNSGVIRASYAAARVNDGGLVGLKTGGSVVDSYWDFEVSGAQISGGGLGLTTVEMKSPTDYAGIYANWNLDLDGDGSADSPWQFSESPDASTPDGSSLKYPLLRSLPVSAYSAPGAAHARPVTETSAEPSPGPRVNIVATMDFEAEGFDDAALSSLSLPQGVTMDPEFRSDHYSYELTVPDDVDRLTFAGRFNPWMKHDGSVSEAFAVLVVGDLATYEWLMNNNGNRELRARMLIANGTASGGTHTIALSPDAATVIEIGVYKTRVGHHYDIYRSEPDNWADRKVVYTLTVTRGDLSANATLSDLTISAGSLAFDPATTGYSVDVGHAVKSVTLTPVASNPDATVTVNGADPATPVQLDYGRNVITVAVTSVDGQATSAYTVAVTRPKPTVNPTVNLVATMNSKEAGYYDALLLNMSLPQGVTIDPEFQSDVRSYRLTVPDDMDRLTFAGRFDPMKHVLEGEAWGLLVVEPGDLTRFEAALVGIYSSINKPIANRAILANSRETEGSRTIALPRDAATVITVAVYKSRLDRIFDYYPAKPEALARKTVYTLTVTRGDPSAGDSSGVTAQSAPAVASPIADLTGLEAGSTRDVSLSGVFSDADGDSLTVTATSSDEAKATVTVAADGSKLTVTGVAVGTATITVTAADGNGGTVSDSFTVTVKSAPTVAAPIADLTGLEVGSTQDVSLSGVFSDADGDSLTVTAVSSDEAKATVTVAADHSKLTVTGVAVGTATITVTAQDADGNRVSDTFDAPVARKYNALIAQVYEWRNDPNGVNNKSHTDRWDRALLAFGETVADASLTPMTAAEARQMAGRYQASRWNPVAEALAEIEAGGSG
ncbi:MAG: cadherin-like beta sandwich domain-containing protein, partial [Chloroflexi bacterium]|nr:cadherin-like beta sandwich domain-containing protein [Chloroflexota bacterium]